MAESKLLEEDKDEWFYQSLKKYSNLYMFELEFPLDTLEIINETSLCVSGVQAYSRKCEILQLCVPPKLLRDENEEGLCKDRDFKILSGGYAEGRIKQLKFVAKSTNLVASCEDGYDGIKIYEVGDDVRATILGKHTLPVPLEAVTNLNAPNLCCLNERIILGSSSSNPVDGIKLFEWKMNGDLTNGPNQTHSIWKNKGINNGNIVKIKEWDDNSCIFITTSGTVALCDLRVGSENPAVSFHASKSPIQFQTKSLGTTSSHNTNEKIIFSFDCLPQLNNVGIIDSCGGYETFDVRYVKEHPQNSSNATKESLAWSLLSQFSELAGVYQKWFNIEYEPTLRENESKRFIISGLKKECVPVFQEDAVKVVNTSADTQPPKNVPGTNLKSVFSHDGHSKSVSHCMWHPVSDNLVFSASIDAVLHAWQFIPEADDNDP